MQPEEYTVQVPTTYTDFKTTMVPKEIEEIKIVQKPFEIEVPVEKVRHRVTRVPVADPAEQYYEHTHADGDEEHRHGAAVDPNPPAGAKSSDDCALIACPGTTERAWMAQDGQCYCGHGQEHTYKKVHQTASRQVGQRAQLAARAGEDGRLAQGTNPYSSGANGVLLQATGNL